MSKSSLAIAALPAKTVEALSRLGKRLQLARKKRDMSLAEVAKLAGISALSAAKIERGKPSVSLRMLLAVMLAMDIGLDIEDIAYTGGIDDDRQKHIRDLEIHLSCMPVEAKPLELLRRLGARIRECRKAKKLRISDVGNCMYASHVTIRQIEKGAPSVSLGVTAAMLACLRLESEFDKIALPERDRVGMSLESHRQSQRKLIRRKRM
jgi:transcriptional regulator with XRE-family HTH domain